MDISSIFFLDLAPNMTVHGKFRSISTFKIYYYNGSCTIAARSMRARGARRARPACAVRMGPRARPASQLVANKSSCDARALKANSLDDANAVVTVVAVSMSVTDISTLSYRSK